LGGRKKPERSTGIVGVKSPAVCVIAKKICPPDLMSSRMFYLRRIYVTGE